MLQDCPRCDGASHFWNSLYRNENCSRCVCDWSECRGLAYASWRTKISFYSGFVSCNWIRRGRGLANTRRQSTPAG
ncbi:MAG: hypothetical protein DMF69_14315 [Acidobacteria bacterium]|nr:MAG: hypothetical protein DMF69_14315 [Acidobacteriota bacterium]